MKLRKFTKRKSATGKPYPQCQHVTGKKQCEKPVYADGRCWEHQQKSGDSVPGGKAISTRSRPPEGVGASADDPFGCLACAHADCGRFYDHNAGRYVCAAMRDNACARPMRVALREIKHEDGEGVRLFIADLPILNMHR